MTGRRFHGHRKARRKWWDMAAQRRAEIVCFARAIDVANTDDFDRFLIAWLWHNTSSKDPIYALIMVAVRMGGILTEARAKGLIEEATDRRPIRGADALGKYLRLSDEMRTKLGIRTIGSFDVSRRQRAQRKKERNRMHNQNKRRTQGMKSRTEYETNSITRTKPWEKYGISRRQWYRHKKAGTEPPLLTQEQLNRRDELRAALKPVTRRALGINPRARGTTVFGRLGVGSGPALGINPKAVKALGTSPSPIPLISTKS
jgi:hypothetical protein